MANMLLSTVPPYGFTITVRRLKGDPKRNRRQGFAFSAILYRYRNLIERFFGKIKYVRGLVAGYNKRADNFLAATKLFSARLWINPYATTA